VQSCKQFDRFLCDSFAFQLNLFMFWMYWPGDVLQAILYNYIMEKLIHCDIHALKLYYGLTGL